MNQIKDKTPRCNKCNQFIKSDLINNPHFCNKKIKFVRPCDNCYRSLDNFKAKDCIWNESCNIFCSIKCKETFEF